MRKAAFVLASSLSLFSAAAIAGSNGLDAAFGSGGIVRFGPTPVSGLVVSLPDRLLDASFDAAPPLPACPP